MKPPKTIFATAIRMQYGHRRKGIKSPHVRRILLAADVDPVDLARQERTDTTIGLEIGEYRLVKTLRVKLVPEITK